MKVPEGPAPAQRTLILDWNSRRIANGSRTEAEVVCTVKNGDTTTVLGYVSSGEEGEVLEVESCFNSVPIMKSHLQKAVRRMKVGSALGATRELIGMDIQSLLRRIPIIAIEDVAPVKGIDVCIWLMIAVTKGFELKRSHLEYLAGFVKAITEFPRKVRRYGELPPGTAHGGDLTPESEVLVDCLKLRRSYGGMKGDMNMLRTLEEHLSSGRQEILDMTIADVRLDSIAVLDRGDSWVPAAVDFHVSSIARKLANTTRHTEQEVKRLMWKHSSSLNARCRAKDVPEEWREIEEQYLSLARWWIRKHS